MNVKKQAKNKRRAPKLNPKLDKGNLQRRIAEGKSNIGAKRVTVSSPKNAIFVEIEKLMFLVTSWILD